MADWKDVPEEQRKEIGKAYFDKMIDMKKMCNQASIDYGKWTLATLFAINAALIVAVKDRPVDYNSGLLIAGMMIFVLLAGMCAWINWALNALMYDKAAQPHLVVDVANHRDVDMPKGIRPTYWITVAFGMLSAACAVAVVMRLLVDASPA